MAHSQTDELLSSAVLSETISDVTIGKVFIVDDEPMVTASLSAMLQIETPHQVLSYNNPKTALAAVETEQPDIVISDFLMPDMDGIAFLKAVKEKLPETTLILLTGYADKENAIEAINTVGIYKYIEKPWNNEELKITLKNGLERSRLLTQLQQKVTALSEARAELEAYNQRLESLVQERTAELTVTVQKLDAIVRGASDGIVTVLPDLTLNAVNPAAAELFLTQLKLPQVMGLPIDTILKMQQGQTISQYFLPDAARLIDDVSVGEKTIEVSISPIPRGELFFPSQHSNDAQLYGASGKNNGHVLILRDISERKEGDRLRNDFISTLTHDLRTPLLAAIQTLDFFNAGNLGPLTSKQQDILTMLIQSNRDMLGLVNVLLEVYKYESGQQRLVMDQVDSLALITTIQNELAALAHNKEQQLNINPIMGAPLVWADKQELKRVLVNLIGNAIHHSPQGTTIDITLTPWQPDASFLCVAVQDYGRGIPAQDIPHLFQRFSQGTSKVRSSGTGLGLYLSRQIVNAHNGHIWVESTEGQGTTFYFTLPVAPQGVDIGT